MIRRALYQIAGIDRATIETCPATDRIWAAHLGFALCLSFTVVLGISYHATGYMIANTGTRLLVSLVIALTVFMFDRALYQSDWFYQGFLWDQSGQPGSQARRLLRVTMRLAMSFGLAWVIALFLELAIFSDTITDRIKQDHIAANQPVIQKIARHEAELASDLDRRRADLALLEDLLRKELATPLPAEPTSARLEDLAQQIKALDAQDEALRAEVRQLLETIKGYAAEMNAEQLGQRLSPTSSGRPGLGPRYQFARQQKEMHEEQRAAREAELAELRLRRGDLGVMEARVIADTAARGGAARAAVLARRQALEAQVNSTRADLQAREATRLERAADVREKALAGPDYQKLRDDPLARMTAYQALKTDPKDGETITLFSWMTKALIIFLEIVPVIAKLFFSPPSVYAARIQSVVERAQRQLREAALVPDANSQSQAGPIAAQISENAAPSGDAIDEAATRQIPLAAASAPRHAGALAAPATVEPAGEYPVHLEPAQAEPGYRASRARPHSVEIRRNGTDEFMDITDLVDEETLRRILRSAKKAR